MVNHYYFYCVDEDFGPFFLKFCSYFPYNAKLCINGHEYLKRQLAKRGVAFGPYPRTVSLRPREYNRQSSIATSRSKLYRPSLLRPPLHRAPMRDTAA
jgi:hypothetical protein